MLFRSPPGSAIATPGSSIGRVSVQAADSSIFPSTMIAESAAKAKIEAAKAATAAKLAESGTNSPELAAKEVKIDVPMGGSKDKDFDAEAMKIREQWMAIRDNAPGGTLSKSKSAQVAQLKIMEQQARGKAQAAKARTRDPPLPSNLRQDNDNKGSCTWLIVGGPDSQIALQNRGAKAQCILGTRDSSKQATQQP